MASGQPARQPIDPVIEKIQHLERKLELTEQQKLQQHIEEFKSQPGREYFEDVRTEMAALLKAGTVKTLQEAYDRAIWANPDVRQRLQEAERNKLEEQRMAAEAKRQKEAREAAQKARKAAGVVVSPRSTLSGGQPAPVGWEDALNAAYDKIAGGI